MAGVCAECVRLVGAVAAPSMQQALWVAASRQTGTLPVAQPAPGRPPACLQRHAKAADEGDGGHACLGHACVEEGEGGGGSVRGSTATSSNSSEAETNFHGGGAEGSSAHLRG